MGVCINWKLSQAKYAVKKTLDRAEFMAKVINQDEAVAKGCELEIRRLGDYSLFIDSRGCETLAIEFMSAKKIKEDHKKEGWNYVYSSIVGDGDEVKLLDDGYEIEKYPKNEIWYAAGFSKTQYGESIEQHVWYAEILRKIASYCRSADVYDEGDYYESGDYKLAVEAIGENAKVIDMVGRALSDAGWKDDKIVRGGETKIK